jgi:probable HAF family extracellular repeat protein
MKTILGVVCVPFLLGTAHAGPPRGTPVFIELPVEAIPTAVGAGGFVSVGTVYGGRGALTWMPNAGVTELGGLEGGAVSLDGKTIVGDTLDANRKVNAAVWQGGREWRLLGSFTPSAQPCDALLSGAFGASDDGKVIVGLGWNGCGYAHGFRWEQGTGMVDLGSSNGRPTRANGVSGDGRVVIGWQEDITGFRMAARWIDGRQELIPGPNAALGEAFGTNRDGSIIVGGGCNPDLVESGAWMWTASAGVRCYHVERKPGMLNVPYNAFMRAVSDDGRVAVGSFSFGLDAESLVWFDGEPIFLEDYLRANGVPRAFEGWVNTGFVTGMTRDGRTLVGYGAGRTGFQGFMVVLPPMESR